MALFCIIVNYNVKQKFTIVDKKRIEKYSRQAEKGIKALIPETAIAHKIQEK